MVRHCYFVGVRFLFVLTCLAMLQDSLPAAEEGDESLFAELDINEDGLLSGNEVKTVRAYDTNGDGRVSREEFLAGRAEERSGDFAREDENFFTERDINQDDFLSGKEIKGLEKFDANADGEISKDEFLAGRKLDRKPIPTNAGKVTREAAQTQFAALDGNADGRLSGTEITDDLRRYDADGDNRITVDEFVAALMKSSQSGADVDPQNKQEVGLEPVLSALKTMDPQPLMAKCHADLLRQIDEPVLRFLLELIRSEHGEFKSPSARQIKVSKLDQGGQTYTVTETDLECENGTIACSVTSLNGQIAGFNIEATATKKFNELFFNAIIDDEEFSRKIADFFTPRCEAFIRLIHAGRDQLAFEMFHPAVQQQLGFEKAAAVFNTIRKTHGEFLSLEPEGIATNFDKNGAGTEFTLEFALKVAKGTSVGKVTLQFDGLKAHIVSYEEAKPDVPLDDDALPPPAPPFSGDDDE